MITYDRDRHELLVVNWYIQELAAKPAEFENLFAKPLRNLTEILFWCSRTVKLFFELDAGGIWIASWLEPIMSGAYWGVWVRADKRKSKSMLAHVNESLDLALVHFPVLMAPTRQPRLRSEMERLGWVHEGEIPFLFDGQPAGVYYLTKESRDARFRRRQDIKQQQLDKLPLRGSFSPDRDADVEYEQAGAPDLRGTGGGSAENGRGERKHPIDKRISGRKPAKRKPVKHRSAPAVS